MLFVGGVGFYDFLDILGLLTGNDPLMTFDPLTEHTPDALTKVK